MANMAEIVDATPSDEVTTGTDVSMLERRLKGLKGQATNVVSTIKGDSFEDRIKTMELVTGSKPLAGLGEGVVIELVDVIVQTIEMEGNAVPRVILVDKSGDAYHAISSPILGSIETLFGVVGSDTSKWARPVLTSLVKVRAAKGTAFTLSFS